ncbi:hypothetical protein Tco_0821285 [Tanacetum coccineum]|uniref:Uncharacterized protein n=1 Tax=Tanacetum coccineum TaxID=301880 RepID=A0ABQ5ACR1_9ASTR
MFQTLSTIVDVGEEESSFSGSQTSLDPSILNVHREVDYLFFGTNHRFKTILSIPSLITISSPWTSIKTRAVLKKGLPSIKGTRFFDGGGNYQLKTEEGKVNWTAHRLERSSRFLETGGWMLWCSVAPLSLVTSFLSHSKVLFHIEEGGGIGGTGG